MIPHRTNHSCISSLKSWFLKVICIAVKWSRIIINFQLNPLPITSSDVCRNHDRPSPLATGIRSPSSPFYTSFHCLFVLIISCLWLDLHVYILCPLDSWGDLKSLVSSVTQKMKWMPLCCLPTILLPTWKSMRLSSFTHLPRCLLKCFVSKWSVVRELILCGHVSIKYSAFFIIVNFLQQSMYV